MDSSRNNRTFRLRRVLEYRQRLTNEAQHELAECERAVTEATSSLNLLHQERAGLVDCVCRAQSGVTLDVETLLAAERHDARLRVVVLHQEQTVIDADQREAEARDKLLSRRVDERALEKLRERHHQEQEQRMRAAQDRLIDEIATTSRGNQQAMSGGMKA